MILQVVLFKTESTAYGEMDSEVLEICIGFLRGLYKKSPA